MVEGQSVTSYLTTMKEYRSQLERMGEHISLQAATAFMARSNGIDSLLLEVVFSEIIGLLKVLHLGRSMLYIATIAGKRDMQLQGVMCWAV